MCYINGGRQHVDTIHWTGFDAQVTTGALIDNDRMHQLRCADDGIYWAGLNAFGAADALIFADIRDAGFRFFRTVFWVER